MKTLNTTINGIKVTLVAIERNESPRTIRESMGVEIKDWNMMVIEEMDDDATLMRADGIDLTNVKYIAEVFPGALHG